MVDRGSQPDALPTTGSKLEWARKLALAGISLKAHSNSAAVCRFYQRYGFVLGGYDRYLYQAMHPGTREIALFWYLRSWQILTCCHRMLNDRWNQ